MPLLWEEPVFSFPVGKAAFGTFYVDVAVYELYDSSLYLVSTLIKSLNVLNKENVNILYKKWALISSNAIYVFLWKYSKPSSMMTSAGRYM